MKVYILAKGCSPWENGLLIYNEAVRQGKNVELGFIEWTFNHILRSIKKAQPDWIFVTGVSSFSSEQLKEFAKIAKVAMWDADGIHEIRDRRWKAISGIPSAVFSVVSNIAERYPTLSPNSMWMPQYYDNITYAPSIVRPTENKNFKYDVCFIGSFDKKRTEWIKQLTDDGIIVRVSTNLYGTEMADMYVQSRIAISIWRDGFPFPGGQFTVSDRIYKAMGCGAFYLLHPVGNLELMFKNKVHLDSYDNTYESLKTQIDYYLQNPEERERIAKVGQVEVLKKHTLKKRISDYWNILEMPDF